MVTANSEHRNNYQKIDLSIVIVNYNTSRLLESCLQSIYDTVDTLVYEVFVVDNASSDDSVELVRSRFPQVRLIVNSEGLGFARSANLAMSQGRGDYFLISHPDVKYLPGTIQEMAVFLAAQPQIGIVGANLLYPDGSYNQCSIAKRSARRELIQSGYASFQRLHMNLPWLQTRLKKAHESFFWEHQTDKESETIWNASMMLKREVLETTGNFCEEFFVWFADTDFCHRAKNAGWKMVYLVNPKVIHYEKQSSTYLDSELVSYKVKWNPAAELLVAKDRLTLVKRHYGLLLLWFTMSLDTFRFGLRYLRHCIDSM